MAIEGELVDSETGDGLFVGADQIVEYTDTAQDMSGWNLTLDFRKHDTTAATKLAVAGVESGTYNATPASNTQKFLFTLADTDLSATTFPGDDWTGRYSIKRTDPGSEGILRYGDVTITRVTQS